MIHNVIHHKHAIFGVKSWWNHADNWTGFFFKLRAAAMLVQTCDSGHAWRLHSAASLRHQAIGTMTCYHTQSHYPDTEPTSPYHILIMPRAGLESNKYQFERHRFGPIVIWWVSCQFCNNKTEVATNANDPNTLPENTLPSVRTKRWPPYSKNSFKDTQHFDSRHD